MSAILSAIFESREDKEFQKLIVSIENNTCHTLIKFSYKELGGKSKKNVKTLAKALPNNTTIQEIDMSQSLYEPSDENLKKILSENEKLWNKKFEIIAPVLAEHSSLSILNLTGNRITNNGVTIFAKTLEENKSLLTLDLSGNQISDMGAIALAKFLKESNTIQKLILNNNGISNSGAIALVNALAKNESLRILDLSYNPIWPQAIASFTSALQANSSLITLNLEGTHVDKHLQREIEDLLLSNRDDNDNDSNAESSEDSDHSQEKYSLKDTKGSNTIARANSQGKQLQSVQNQFPNIRRYDEDDEGDIKQGNEMIQQKNLKTPAKKPVQSQSTIDYSEFDFSGSDPRNSTAPKAKHKQSK